MNVWGNPGFDARRGGQVAAFFVLRQGGLLNVVKLIKLLYLADREHMARYEEPMFMDNFVSMRLGPVNSRAYECVNTGSVGWDDFISDRANHDVGLARDIGSLDELDELSESDVEILEDIWSKFGHMSQWALVDYTHKNCPEWEDPDGSSTPIPYSRVFKFLNKEDPTKLEKKIIERRALERVLTRFK